VLLFELDFTENFESYFDQPLNTLSGTSQYLCEMRNHSCRHATHSVNSADQDQPAHTWRQFIACTGDYSVSTYFKISHEKNGFMEIVDWWDQNTLNIINLSLNCFLKKKEKKRYCYSHFGVAVAFRRRWSSQTCTFLSSWCTEYCLHTWPLNPWDRTF
jgi:hypothetical protein